MKKSRRKLTYRENNEEYFSFTVFIIARKTAERQKKGN